MFPCHETGFPIAADSRRFALRLPLAVEIDTFRTNPRRQRGSDLTISLALRASLGRNRAQHNDLLRFLSWLVDAVDQLSLRFSLPFTDTQFPKPIDFSLRKG